MKFHYLKRKRECLETIDLTDNDDDSTIDLTSTSDEPNPKHAKRIRNIQRLRKLADDLIAQDANQQGSSQAITKVLPIRMSAQDSSNPYTVRYYPLQVSEDVVISLHIAKKIPSASSKSGRSAQTKPRKASKVLQPRTSENKCQSDRIPKVAFTESPTPQFTGAKTFKEEMQNIWWKSMYQRLVEYHKIHGHTLVPKKYRSDKKLGQWVEKQRTATLDTHRTELLDKIGFFDDWKAANGMRADRVRKTAEPTKSHTMLSQLLDSCELVF